MLELNTIKANRNHIWKAVRLVIRADNGGAEQTVDVRGYEDELEMMKDGGDANARCARGHDAHPNSHKGAKGQRSAERKQTAKMACVKGTAKNSARGDGEWERRGKEKAMKDRDEKKSEQ